MNAVKMSLKDQVRDSIFMDIINGNLQGIVNEKGLIERYGVSKTSVREALIELCTQGVMKAIPRCGYEIVTVSDSDIMDATELRLLIELSSFEKAVKNMGAEDIQSLKALAFRLQHKLSLEIWQYWDRNLNFHVRLTSFAGNRLTTGTLENTLRILWRANAQYWRHKQAKQMQLQGQHPHQKMMLLIEQGEIAEAKLCLEEDIKNVPRAIREISW